MFGDLCGNKLNENGFLYYKHVFYVKIIDKYCLSYKNIEIVFHIDAYSKIISLGLNECRSV